MPRNYCAVDRKSIEDEFVKTAPGIGRIHVLAPAEDDRPGNGHTLNEGFEVTITRTGEDLTYDLSGGDVAGIPSDVAADVPGPGLG